MGGGGGGGRDRQRVRQADRQTDGQKLQAPDYDILPPGGRVPENET